jgi:DNA end-binding protein Ku
MSNRARACAHPYTRSVPARSVANGTLSFGLVSIPVRLYAATQPSASISFNLLHAKDGARLKQQYVCSKDGEKVDREDMVKGYEFAKDRYVTFNAEELKALDEMASQTIDIAEFVPASAVDPVYFDRAYHLGPDKGGGKAYKLLAIALEQSGKAALARYAARGKQYLVLIRPRSGRLVMQQLYYPDEVRPLDEVDIEDAQVKDAEVDLALQLIAQTASERFEPGKYEDSVKKRTLEAIERKVAGQEIQIATPEPQAQVIDLMEALKASLAAPGAAAPAAAAAGGEARAAVAPAASEPEGEDERHPARAARAETAAPGKKTSSRK